MGELVFELSHIDVPQGAADGCFTGQPAPLWLEGGQQKRGVALHPVRNGGSAALLAQHGTRNHTEEQAHASRLPRAWRGSGTAVSAANTVLYCGWSIVRLLTTCGYV